MGRGNSSSGRGGSSRGRGSSSRGSSGGWSSGRSGSYSNRNSYSSRSSYSNDNDYYGSGGSSGPGGFLGIAIIMYIMGIFAFCLGISSNIVGLIIFSLFFILLGVIFTIVFCKANSKSSGKTTIKVVSKERKKIKTIIIAIMVIVVGAIFSYVGINELVKFSKYSSVDAVCVDNTYSMGYYYTTYTYTVNNVDYENTSSEGWELKETVGNTVKIFYLKSNPKIISEILPSNINVGGGIISLILSFAGITTGVIILVVTLKKKKEEIIEPIPIKSKTIKCEYCGTVIIGKNDSCINCGAAIKDKED